MKAGLLRLLVVAWLVSSLPWLGRAHVAFHGHDHEGCGCPAGAGERVVPVCPEDPEECPGGGHHHHAPGPEPAPCGLCLAAADLDPEPSPRLPAPEIPDPAPLRGARPSVPAHLLPDERAPPGSSL